MRDAALHDLQRQPADLGCLSARGVYTKGTHHLLHLQPVQAQPRIGIRFVQDFELDGGQAAVGQGPSDKMRAAASGLLRG